MSDGIDQMIDDAFRPIAETLVDLVFVSIDVNGTELPLIVAWLVIGSIFFSIYLISTILTVFNISEHRSKKKQKEFHFLTKLL